MIHDQNESPKRLKEYSILKRGNREKIGWFGSEIRGDNKTNFSISLAGSRSIKKKLYLITRVGEEDLS